MAEASRTSEAHRDAVFARWVIFSPARSRRPTDLKSHGPANPSPGPDDGAPKPSCPFCLGRESECAPEIFRVPAPDESPSWRIRVIENLFPALRREAAPPAPEDEEPVGAGECAVRGFGFHDVVIETPHHEVRLWDLEAEGVRDVLLAYARRVQQLAEHPAVKYVQVFKNQGASAGASMAHSHSQMLGTPFVPPSVTSRLNCMKEVFERSGKCSLCAVVSKDILVSETHNFSAFVPFAASYPFEIWIVPRQHSSYFHETDQDKVLDLAGLLKSMLQKLCKQLNDSPFNYMIHSAPFGLSSSCLPYTHWFLQIVPQLSVIGGFEIGSGCHINPVFPEDAAKILREIDGSV
ncbi:ADP-glucose phosphorylase-like [Triticum dicoccoides]|uniref:Galactose-1-phosphate uridyl transferase N-terminal domain-containing protein n=2 Tax=Triticum aestivum TaxID=4565 RepID=A0A3B6NS00_WHEAT|nr:ADP-glucose phosphorylase-like [Triticum dicoccoides]XP_044404227.1 ADP-glucose phosphorylase-like [Triticum aestivum]